MSARNLPDFETPPVNEVVLSVQFAPLSTLTCAHFGVFWTTIRDKYVRASELAPLDPRFETFGGPTFRSLHQVEISTLLKPPVPRFLFETQSGNEVLQLQQDRIVHSWRRKSEIDVYPRYEHVRAELENDISSFLKFLKNEELGDICATQCEATYVNIITLAPGTDPHREVSRIMTIANEWPTGGDMPELENTVIQSSAICKRDGQAVCRLFLQLQPVIVAAKSLPAIRLDLTTRGKPAGETPSAALSLLDFARECIVKTFAGVTTPAMHNTWGRRDGD